MKKICTVRFISALFLFGLFATIANAEISIEAEGDIAGSWLLEKSSTTLDGPRVSRGETWIIGNGQLEKKDVLLARSGTYDVPPMPLKIESGKMLVSVVGRPGKFESYELIEKEGNSMVLHTKSEGFLFFLRQ